MNKRKVCIALALLISLTLALAAGVGSSLAYIVVRADTLTNTFTAPELPPVVEPTPEGTPAPTEAPDLPQTGDNANVLLYAALLAGSCAGAALLKRRERP